MQRIEGRFIYSASDLNGYLECKRLTELDSLVARGMLARPDVEDEGLELIRRKGEAHEGRQLECARERHPGRVTCIARPERSISAFSEAQEQTLAAMRAGAAVIYQATFYDGTFLGHADFLRRIEKPSPALGAWSYEVIDTKLALHTKPYFLVQLCNYSEHLSRLQGTMPERGWIVLGDGTETAYRLGDYLAYYRHLRTAFLAFAAAHEDGDAPRQYPYPRTHCAVCPWNDACAQRRYDDDHLSLVAWMRRDQIGKLEASQIATVEQLAAAGDAMRPTGMPQETFVKLRRQADLQVRGRTERRLLYEVLSPAPATGFALLPAPAEGDVFFDIEGDPLYEPGRGLEYLFGFWAPADVDPPASAYRAFWAHDPSEEKACFERVVDFITERRKKFPGMHVYHYAPYETSALKRLKQLHCTRENDVDDLLRSDVFVDLYAVVRQGLALSTSSYGLKAVEKFYPLKRLTEVQKGDQSIVMFERWRSEGDRAILDDIARYNRDDCLSTSMLRDWLLERREEAMRSHGEIPFRAVKTPADLCHEEFVESCKRCGDRRKKEREEARRGEIESALLEREERVARLLAHLVAYHRREEQPEWWAYYDRIENVDELLEFDREAIAGLVLLEDRETERDKNSYVYTYAYPDQFHKMEPGTAVDPRSKKTLTVLSVDDERNLLRLKTTMSLDQARQIKELIPRGPYSTDAQRAALAAAGAAFLAGTLERDFPATYDLLTGRNPRPEGTLQPEHVCADTVLEAVRKLDRSYLFVQGPPGSGKTTIGSRVICDLLAAGYRVAVMSTGHKAIHNLLRRVEECMRARQASFRGRYKDSGGDSEYVSAFAPGFIRSVNDNALFDSPDYELAGGTAWLFSRPELRGAFDYLFIDEAGQVSLADALAVSLCAKNVVLLGDPSQLAQVSQATHPMKEAKASVLTHLLGDAQTVPPERGIFLDVSYRMHPEICAFVSEAMYEGRLKAAAGTALHRVIVSGEERAGLCFSPVEHEGNGSSSVEEAHAVVGEILQLLDGEAIDSQPAGAAGVARPIEDRDVIVVTPYNAQRRLLAHKLRAAGVEIEVGTVDKFQGQEAAVVFYSMATSSGEDVPRNMKFLFAANRFNVAVSRARALSVLMCSPRLLDASCNSPEEMALVNLLCAFAERTAAKRELQPAR